MKTTFLSQKNFQIQVLQNVRKKLQIETCEMVFTSTMSPNSKSALTKNIQYKKMNIPVESRMEPIGSVSGNFQYLIPLQPSSLETKSQTTEITFFWKFKFCILRDFILKSKCFILISKNMKYLKWLVFYIIFPNIVRIVHQYQNLNS